MKNFRKKGVMSNLMQAILWILVFFIMGFVIYSILKNLGVN